MTDALNQGKGGEFKGVCVQGCGWGKGSPVRDGKSPEAAVKGKDKETG